ncbi:MAG: LamG domain-containing protein [Myxococcota bacterium]|nr:LamG domain-containing protein [Myxococcota bacterium]
MQRRIQCIIGILGIAAGILGCVSESSSSSAPEPIPLKIAQQESPSSASSFDLQMATDWGRMGSQSSVRDARDDECCTEPGQLAECWTQDAEMDGVTCTADSDCASNSCDLTYGLCTCTAATECGAGVCTSLGVCGPSYCNGYKICSCWGGCTDIIPSNTPAMLCEAEEMACCNGKYPIHPDLREETDAEIGFCSADFTCDESEGGDACESDEDCPDDGVACTEDYCDLDTTLCVYDPNHTLCDDGNICTDDICDPELGCVYVNNADACDDGNACTENDTCSGGTCIGDPVDCDDGNPCTDDACDPATGCYYTNNTDPCNDNNACTVDDVCTDGVCVGAPRDCSDGNPCTDDSCNTATGCVYDNNTDVCDDANACTEGDVCANGVCAGLPVSCDDANICTDDSCDIATGCINANNTEACSDGNACTVDDVCADGSCQPGAPAVCDDTNVCTDDTCNPAIGCVFTNNTDPCDDLTVCTSGDACVGGICTGAPIDCDDDNFCTDDSCDAALGCVYAFNEENECDDGNACTVDDHCSLGECAGVLIHWRFEEDHWDGTPDEVIDSADMYHGTSDNDAYPIANGKVGQAGRFDPGAGGNVGQVETSYRVHANSRTMAFWIKFDNVFAGHQTVGSFSGGGKRFYLGIDGINQIFAGYGNTFVGFSKPSVPSTIESGVWARMAMTFDGTTVHVYVNNIEIITFDATFHAGGEGPAYFLGTQEGNVEIDEAIVDERYWKPEDVARDYDNGNGPDPYLYTINCDDENPCTDDSCDKDIGCVHTYNTDACDDGSACTQNDVCSNGTCGGAPVDCDDGNICTDDTCDALLGCVYDNNTASCDDGNSCTENDVCADGACGGTPLDCNDANPCTDDTCVPGVGCTYANNTDACDDANACTESDVCAGGSCSGTPIDCDDGDRCTQDTCAPLSGCVYTPIDPCPECNDAADCTGIVTCNPPPVGCTQVACDSGTCVCDPEPVGSACTDYSQADYPPNCYDGLCDAAGICQPTGHAAYNNLCSDVFVSGSPTVVDTTADSYLGAIPNTVTGGAAALLTTTGSTRCANNNYWATGDECIEQVTSNPIGQGGPELVYVFEYQTNGTEQYELYSYIVKVEADYDVGIYLKTDISSAGDCPEGNNPDMDDPADTFLGVSSNRCAYPYQNTPMPPVVEDECDDSGNILNNQECCDPCIEGEYCGYKWCKRGYNYDGTSCDMCDGAGGPGYDEWTHLGTCDDLWVYPEDPFNCDSETPAGDPGYDDYDYAASAVISPDGATDGSWRKVFVFIDGVDSTKGNFYLTVEKRRWWAGPCDRINDDARVYDVTHVGTTGETFTGTLANVVNSVHDCGGSCGGYGCDCGWSGKTSCHGSGSENEFWPNSEHFKIFRTAAEGSQNYCIETDESIADAADLVVDVSRRRSGALTICDESYSGVGCRRNNDGNNVRWEFTAAADRLYLIGVSQYSRINKVCSPAGGDDCNYQITVTEGGCPAACVDPSTWYGGPILGTYTVDGTGFSPGSVISGDTSSGSASNYDVLYWRGPDDLWRIDVTQTATVTFSCCSGSGSCFSRSRAKLYDCMHNQVASNTNGCGTNRPHFTSTLSPALSPYYLLVDGRRASNNGPYAIQLSY